MIVSEFDDHVVVRFQKATQLGQSIVQSNLEGIEIDFNEYSFEKQQSYRNEFIGHCFRHGILSGDDATRHLRHDITHRGHTHERSGERERETS